MSEADQKTIRRLERDKKNLHEALKNSEEYRHKLQAEINRYRAWFDQLDEFLNLDRFMRGQSD